MPNVQDIPILSMTSKIGNECILTGNATNCKISVILYMSHFTISRDQNMTRMHLKGRNLVLYLLGSRSFRYWNAFQIQFRYEICDMG